MPAKLTANELADKIGTHPKKLRMYLREHNVAKDAETGRYAFTTAQANKIVKDFNDWETKRLAPTPSVTDPSHQCVVEGEAK